MAVLNKLEFTRQKLPVKIKLLLQINSAMIHYPKNPHTKYPQWVWCKDEFVPPLTKQEFQKYINNAESFRKDYFAKPILNLVQDEIIAWAKLF